ncbi:MAG TPA: alpha/beta hydrolase [Methylibium sp.]
MSIWILLRGLTREARHWGDFPSLLGAELPGAQVLALDLPGNGSLHGMKSPTRVEAMAEHCRRELRERGMAPPYHLLAMSLGAMVAVAWGHAHPEELAACVLVNTSLRPYSPFHERLRPGSYADLLRIALWPGGARQWEESVLKLTSRSHAPGSAQREALLQRWVSWHREQPVSRANAARQLLAAGRYRAPQSRLAPPTLLLTSERDALVSTRCSIRLAEAWQCAIASHAQAGHDLPLEDGTWVARQIALWLQTGVAYSST